MPTLEHEIRIGGIVAGIDEAGRGPLAGPVVAAAVVLEANCIPEVLWAELDDSKQLSAKKREALYAVVMDCAKVGIGLATVEEIDRINILKATFLAMGRAMTDLGLVVDCALVDGNQKPPLACRVECLVGGDGLSLSIAAASVVAKVTRDRMMIELARDFPGYGWETNVGYGTAEHHRGLQSLGPTIHHRRSFQPVFDLLDLMEGKREPA